VEDFSLTLGWQQWSQASSRHHEGTWIQ